MTHDIVIPDEVVVAVAAGEAHSAALTASGHVFVWGSNASGAPPGLRGSLQAPCFFAPPATAAHSSPIFGVLRAYNSALAESETFFGHLVL